MSGAPVVDCLRVSVTDRCNLRCIYCMPAEGLRCAPRESLLRFEEIAAVVRVLRERFGLRTVRLTGGDPLVRVQITHLVGLLARTGVEDLALTTNGQRLAELAAPLREAGIGRVNISLDSLDAARFARLTRGGRLDETLAGIEAARQAGFRAIKLNTVVLRGENDAEVGDLVRFALARALEIRFLELMAIGVSVGRHAAWFVSSEEVLARLKTEFRMTRADDMFDPRTRIHLAQDAHGRQTRVGFIAPETQPFCAGCRRLRLTSDGRLLGCLMHSGGVSLMPVLRRADGPDEAALAEAIQAALATKPALRAAASDQFMAAVGG